MATKTAARKQVKDYRQQLVVDLKQKYDCTSCGYTLSGELQIWFKSKICISLKVNDPVETNYDNILADTCKIVDIELKTLGLKKSEDEKEVSE